MTEISPESVADAGVVSAASEARQRVAACEQEVTDALTPIFAKYRCRLAIAQTYIDGVPEPPRIAVVAVKE